MSVGNKYTQLIPILVVDVLTAATFGLAKAQTEQARRVPLITTLILFASLSIPAIVCVITCSKHRWSSFVVFLLCALKIVQFGISIADDGQVSLLAPVEYFLMITMLVLIPHEYFVKARNVRVLPYTAHFSKKKMRNASDFPRKGEFFVMEPPESPAPDIGIALEPSTHSIDEGSWDFTINPFKIVSRKLTKRKFSANTLGKQPVPAADPTTSLDSPTSQSSLDSPSSPSLPISSAPSSPRKLVIALPASPLSSSEQANPTQPSAIINLPRLLPVVEKWCIWGEVICCAATWIIGAFFVYENTSNANLMLVLSSFVWCSLALGIVLVCVQLVKVQRSTLVGNFFGRTHTHGLVTVLVMVGIVIRIVYDFFALLVAQVSVVDYISGKERSLFIQCGKYIVTQLLPFGFHCFNILADKHYTSTDAVGHCNTGKRMRITYLLLVMSLHWMIVGHAFHISDLHSATSSQVLAVCARAAAYAASIDFCFIIMALISPIAFTFYQFFNFGAVRRSIHRIHIHRSMVVSGFTFTFLHILFHAISWIKHSSYHIEAIENAFVSGIVMLFAFCITGISGYASTFTNSRRVWRSVHLPFAAIGLLAFAGHGRDKGHIAPLGSYMILATSCLCAGIYALFFLINPPKRMLVDNEHTKWCDTLYQDYENYTILALAHGNRFYLPPGAFFTIYVPQSSSLSYVHGHPFPVFSNRNGLLYFLVKCRKGRFVDHASFTQQLLILRPQYLYIQGPFFGPSNAFIQSLTSLDQPAHVFLCGWGSGFANVYALLEHFKVHSKSYAIKSINCVFSKAANPTVNEAIDSFVNELVCEWESPIPLSIIEVKDRKLEHIWVMASKQVSGLNKVELMNVWKENFNHCNKWVAVKEQPVVDDELRIPIPTNEASESRDRAMSVAGSPKVLYFCGSSFNHQAFQDGWQVHVETIP